MAEICSTTTAERKKFKIDANTGEVEVQVCDNDVQDLLGDILIAVGGSTGTVTNLFNEISSVASASQTSVITYTVPVGKTFSLQFVEAGGDNIAKYEVFRDTTLIAKRRSYWGAGLDISFLFIQTNSQGLVFNAGEKIEVKVEHNRPNVADFNARIIGVLEDV